MNMFDVHEPVLSTRDLYERQAPIPELRIRALTGDVPMIQKRSSSDSSNGSSSSQSLNITPIVIGVVVPVLIIAIILFVVWRRRSKITKEEESHDKYRSLDFGVDPNVTKETKRRKSDKRSPEMSVVDMKDGMKRNRGVSIDLGMTNPYLLPPEVHQSQESLRSLSRTIHNGDDRYRATTFVPDDGSIRSPSSLRGGHDSSSIFTGSTKRFDTDSMSDFYSRAPSRTAPYGHTSQPPQSNKASPNLEKPQGGFLAPALQDHDRNSTLSTNSGTAAIRASNNYLAKYIYGGEKKAEEEDESSKKEDQPGLIVTTAEVEVTPTIEEPRQPPAAAVRNVPYKRSSSIYDQSIAELADTEPHVNREPTLPPIPAIPAETSHELDSSSRSRFPPRHQSQHAPEFYDQAAHIDQQVDNIKGPSGRAQSTNMKITQANHDDDAASDYYEEPTFTNEQDYQDYQDYIDYTYRGSTIGVRPLPPDDPSENPEQRANRIRSFYKEYFEDGSGGSKGAPPPPQPAYYDGSEQYHDNVVDAYYEMPPPILPDGRHRAMSQGPPVYRGGPRAFSSMSGKMGPAHRMAPKKKLPPPKPLMTLPTPHKLKEDDFLPNAIDFAPPQIFKNQRSGTPDSLRGELRPYSPSVRAHVPLTSSFDDLAVMPSP